MYRTDAITSAPLRNDRAPSLAVRMPETVSMLTRDGVRLDADIYRPASGGPYPVLLQRQAYGRRIACTICYAHPSWYAAQGYVVVVQDIRGRGTSKGDFHVGEHDTADGVDTLDWVSRLDGVTGDVGMYGFSYQGYNQMMAALAAPPALKAMAPAMAPWHVRDTWAYENGAFRLQGGLGWATQIAAETARHRGDAVAYAELLAQSRALNISGAVQARPDYIERHRALSHYHRWLDTPPGDPYWDAISPAAHVDVLVRLNLPMLFVGGWYDTHLRSTWDAVTALTERGHDKIEMTIGPWLHFPWGRKIGGVDFGPDAACDMDRAHIRFFDRWLKDTSNVAAAEQPIRLFDLGSKRWTGFDRLPAATCDFALCGSGRATMDAADGLLVKPGDANAVGIDYVVNDPWRPSPSVGGAFGTPPGPVERSDVDARGDAATFTTRPFDVETTFAGAVSATLHVTCDASSFDIACVLSRITASGQVMHLTDGYRCVKAGEPRDGVTMPMRATCITLATGEALRLSISAASFPAYPVNPGTGEDPTRAASATAKVITLGIRYGEGQRSRLTLTCSPSSKDNQT